jgi:hypothetical protein
MALFKVILGTIPATLNDEVTLPFDLPVEPAHGGVLFYMIDTRRGDRTYKITMNGEFEEEVVLPAGNYLCTLNTAVSNLRKRDNVLRFTSLAGNQHLELNLFNVVLLYEG